MNTDKWNRAKPHNHQIWHSYLFVSEKKVPDFKNDGTIVNKTMLFNVHRTVYGATYVSIRCAMIK